MTTSNNEDGHKAVVGGVKHKGKRSLFFKFPLVVVVVLSIIGAALFYYQHRQPYQTGHCSKGSSQACTLLKEATTDLDPSKTDKLAKSVDQIKQVKNYQKDPNLMYVITIFYINTADSKNAHSTYDAFSKVYDDNKGYDDILIKTALSPGNLKQLVTSIDVQNKATQQNAYTVKEPK